MYNIFNCIDLSLGGKSRTQKRIAQFKNQVEFMNALNRLVEKGLARYDFEDLPDTVNDRVLKMSLLFHGSVCFFEKDGGILALPAAPNSNLNLYGDYKSCFVYGRNGFNDTIPLFIPGTDEAKIVGKGFYTLNQNEKPRGVYVRENKMTYPFINYCIAYAEKIADCMRTIDVVRANIKRPFVITAEEQLVPTVKKFFETRDENVEYIVSSGVFPADKINILPIDTNVDALKSATDLIEWYYNDFDNLCQKNSNANPDKKERLLVDEVNANNESKETSEESFRDYLTEQLDFVNECLGTNIKLKEVEEDDAVQRMGANSNTGSDRSVGSGRSNDSAD